MSSKKKKKRKREEVATSTDVDVVKRVKTDISISTGDDLLDQAQAGLKFAHSAYKGDKKNTSLKQAYKATKQLVADFQTLHNSAVEAKEATNKSNKTLKKAYKAIKKSLAVVEAAMTTQSTDPSPDISTPADNDDDDVGGFLFDETPAAQAGSEAASTTDPTSASGLGGFDLGITLTPEAIALRAAEEEKKNRALIKANLEKQTSTNILFLGQLPYTATVASVTEFFKPHLQADYKIRLLTDKKTKKPRGIGFLEVTGEDDLERALGLHHSSMNGRVINIEQSAKGLSLCLCLCLSLSFFLSFAYTPTCLLSLVVNSLNNPILMLYSHRWWQYIPS